MVAHAENIYLRVSTYSRTCTHATRRYNDLFFFLRRAHSTKYMLIVLFVWFSPFRMHGVTADYKNDMQEYTYTHIHIFVLEYTHALECVTHDTHTHTHTPTHINKPFESVHTHTHFRGAWCLQYRFWCTRYQRAFDMF